MLYLLNLFNWMGLSIDNTATIGDILTSLTILTSLFLFLISFYRDRKLRRKEQADKVRYAAAKIIGKLDRWKEVSLSIFQPMDVIFVEASEQLQRDYNTESVRNFLWKGLENIKNETKEKMLEEDIETAYVELSGFDPYVRSFFLDVLTHLKKEEDSMFEGFRHNIQSDVRSFNYKNKDKYTTSDLRDQLYKHANNAKEIYENRISELLIPVSKNLFRIIMEKDSNLNKHIKKENRSYFINSNKSIIFSEPRPELYLDEEPAFGEIVNRTRDR